MLIAKVINTKDFMSALLKKDTFDDFEARDVSITTFASFEIRGILNKEFYEKPEETERNYAFWKELKPYAFEMIKGSRLPKYIKIIFSANDRLINQVSDKASALFINIIFENNELTIITGSSLKNFALDKSVEFMWDEWVRNFFSCNAIALTDPEYEEI